MGQPLQEQRSIHHKLRRLARSLREYQPLPRSDPLKNGEARGFLALDKDTFSA